MQRPLMISGMLAILLVLVGWYYDALLFAPFGLLALLWQILCAIYFAVRRDRQGLKVSGVRMLIWMAAMAILITVHNQYLKNTRKNAEAVVTALQNFRAREGYYPKDLEALVPRDIAVLPKSAMSPRHVYPFQYRTVPAGEAVAEKALSFNLRFHTGFRHQHIYDSVSGQWKLTD